MNVAPTEEIIEKFEESGGKGKPKYGQITVCYAKSKDEAKKTAFAVWPNALLYLRIASLGMLPVLADGSMLANELAPRVHNSGHWTEAACIVSQFEQHIRAIADLPLGSPARHCGCVMENLIGDDILKVPALLAEPDLMLHLYGKAESRPGRKMGHFTRIRR